MYIFHINLHYKGLTTVGEDFGNYKLVSSSYKFAPTYVVSVTSKKSLNVYRSCPKMVSLVK